MEVFISRKSFSDNQILVNLHSRRRVELLSGPDDFNPDQREFAYPIDLQKGVAGFAFDLPPPLPTVNDKTSPSEYLVISRGQWDKDLAPETIQAAIDQFYVWRDGLVAQGKMKAGQRLATEGRLVTQHTVKDGPFAEAKEVIGGYWFFMAGSLDEAAALAAQNPCLACGLACEVRPIESERASAFKVTNETPVTHGGRVRFGSPETERGERWTFR